MDCWLPPNPDAQPIFRKPTSSRVIFDVGAPSTKRWRFVIRDAYLPRKTIWPGDDLAVRFLLQNDSVQEGTAYYIVRLRDPFRANRLIFDSDRWARRQANIVSIPAHDATCIQVLIPWSELEPYLASIRGPVLTVSIDIEVWVPRRVRVQGHSLEDWVVRHFRAGLFQKVTLFANPTIMLRAPAGSCFISYAWDGAPSLPPHAHRAWIYTLADALGLADVRAEVDYNFLTPAAINKRVIDRHLSSSDRILIVYSDAYLERLQTPGTGVQFEYDRLRSRPELWAKSFPIRKHVMDRERQLYQLERRYIVSFEAGDLATNVNSLVRHMSPLPSG